MQIQQHFQVKVFFWHCLFWLCYIYYHGVIYNWQDTDQLRFDLSFHVGGLPILITILLTYFNLYVLLPAFYERQQYGYYSLALIFSLLAGALLTRFLTHQFVLPWEKLHDPERYALEVKHFWIPARILRLAIQYYPAIAIVMVFELMRKAHNNNIRLREVERESAVAEMRFLKAQINPHFFFNTLNSLYALIIKRSDEAATLVMRLSQQMRYMLDKAGADEVDLATEIAALENYLRIEQLRFSDRLELSFQYSGDINGKTIMPLALLPFAENAFKHGVEAGKAWVAIDLKVTANMLFYSVENSKPVNNGTGIPGMGLANLRRRLELAYPARHSLTILDMQDVFKATLKIEL